MTRGRAAALLAVALATLGAGVPNEFAPQPGQAPFGDKIAEQRLPTYHRATKVIATSGPIGDKGVIEAKHLGFAAIADLRPAGDDTAAERQGAEYAHIRYVNIPVEGAPTAEQVKRFADVVADRDNLPLLLHGADIDQSGAMWALYRASLGVPPAIAFEDGVTAGLNASGAAVQARLDGTKPQ